jgi:hypoxanthine phosphoribosyltransferase
MSSQTASGGDLWRRQALYLLTWNDFDAGIRSIASQVRATGDGIDCIVGISRGGLIPAVALSNVLGVSALHVIAVSRNVGNGQYLDKQPPRALSGADLEAVRGKHVLVVDDVAGTGETLHYVREKARDSGAASVRAAILVRMQQGASVADFVGVELDDWVVFPWEELPDGQGRTITVAGRAPVGEACERAADTL